MKLGHALEYKRGDTRVRDLYDEWVNKRPPLEQERDALVQIMTRPPRVRTGSFSASSAGSCLRRRQFEYYGLKKAKPGTKSMNIFANGDYVHLRIQVAGLTGGWLREAEVSVEDPEIMLKGTMDGDLVWDSILEAKSINSNGFRTVNSFGAKAEHVYQVHAYMLASGRSSAHILYENKDTQDMKEFRVERDEKVVDLVREEFQTLTDATNEKVLLPMLPQCVEKTGDDYRWCPFAKQCLGVTSESLGLSPTPRTFSIQRD